MPKLCNYLNCRNRATYGKCNGQPLRCKEHKDDLKYASQLCYCGKSRPSFNYEGKPAEYCKDCAKDDDMVNVKDKKCIKCNTKHPSFNYKGKPARYCKDCAKDDMIDVKSKKCIKCNTKHPNFNYEGKPAEYCKDCAADDMVNVVSNKCPGLDGFGCMILGNRKYKHYCTECFRRQFPLDPLTFQIRSKNKEIAVRDYINEIYEGFQHDKPIYTDHCDCSVRRRIDHRKMIGNTILAIETDENQHKPYDERDENERYDDLMCGFTCKWIYIRFNPDKYKDKNGKTKNPEIATRLKVLKKMIDRQIERINNEENTELIEIHKLYYDKFT